MVARIVLVLVLSVVAGCASPRGAGQFPTQAELERIAPLPETRSLLLAERRDVPTWVIDGPVPVGDARSVSTELSPWAHAIDQSAQGRPVPLVRTRAMECAARELGRFFLEHGGRPAEGLQRFILSVCGSDVSSVKTALVEGAVPDAVPTDRLIGEWNTQWHGLVASLLADGRDDRAGVWFGRANGRAVVMVVAGESRADFSAISRVPDQKDRVRIRGRLKTSAASVTALVNHGRFGVEECEVDPRAALPEFALSCPVDRRDAQAWISISAFPPERVLGDTVLDLLVWPGGVRTGRYDRPARPRSEPFTTTDQAPGAILRVLNEVRREASLPELGLAQKQSATARELAPRYLLALTGEEPEETADKIALGMMAGWEVPGIVRHGRVAGAFSVQTQDVGDLLAAALELPNGRYTLLDPKARAIAIGPLSRAEGKMTMIGALVGTYAFFDEQENLARGSDVAFGKLVRASRAHGVREVTRAGDLMQAAVEAARAVHRNELSLKRAMDAAMAAAASQRPGVEIAGLYLEVSDLDQVTFQDDFFKFASMSVGIALTTHKPRDWPWGRYVLIVVAAGEQPLLTAGRRPAPGEAQVRVADRIARDRAGLLASVCAADGID